MQRRFTPEIQIARIHCRALPTFWPPGVSNKAKKTETEINSPPTNHGPGVPSQNISTVPRSSHIQTTSSIFISRAASSFTSSLLCSKRSLTSCHSFQPVDASHSFEALRGDLLSIHFSSPEALLNCAFSAQVGFLFSPLPTGSLTFLQTLGRHACFHCRFCSLRSPGLVQAYRAS